MHRPILRQAVRESSIMFRRAVSPLLLIRRRALWLLLAFVSSCDNEPSRSFIPQMENTERSSTIQADVHRRYVSQFNVRVQALDKPSLGVPIRVSVSVTALVASSSARITLSIPEMEIAKVSGGALREPPTGFRMPLIVDQTLSFAPGQRRDFSGTFVVTQPGYYRLLAVALSSGTRAVDRASVVQNVAQAETWLYVDENGGILTPAFDPRVIPDTVVATPGPRQLARHAVIARVNSQSVVTSGYVANLKYVNTDVVQSGTYDPVAGARLDGKYLYPNGLVVQSFTAFSDHLGRVTIPCVWGTYFDGYARLTNSSISISSSSATSDSLRVLAHDPCYGGSGWHVIPSSPTGRAWATLNATILNSAAYFLRTRPWIRVRITDDQHYHWPADSITVDSTTVWGENGAYQIPHEYGHAFHAYGLGVPVPGLCPLPGANHLVTGAYNLRCAYIEGFADFFASFVAQDSIVGYWEDLFEFPRATLNFRYFIPHGYLCSGATEHFCANGPLTTDGAIGETTVAAFFYDLADNASTANSTPDDDDAVGYGAAWIGNVIAACEILWGSWAQHDAIDHLVRCFEHRLGNYSADGYFPERNPVPAGWRLVQSVSDPPGWSADAVKTVWQSNLYFLGPPQAPPPPPPPPPSVTISGHSMVRPGAECLWSGNATGGVPPYSWQWNVDGNPVGDGSPTLRYTNNGASFTIFLTVVDAQNGTGAGSYGVSVSSEAPECLDQ